MGSRLTKGGAEAASVLPVPAFDSGRRLCLLFDAGHTRYAIDATSVVEVATPAPLEDRVRGVLELKDLSLLLGGAAEVRPGVAVVLDVSPTLTLRIRGVQEVADVAQAPHFLLPPALNRALAPRVRGALLRGGRLYRELGELSGFNAPLSALDAVAAHSPSDLLREPPERALIFESAGRLYGFALPFVSQVVNATAAFCPFPSLHGPVVGLFPHAQSLWPIYSLPALLRTGLLPEPAEPKTETGAEARAEPLSEALFVLTELAGQSVGFCASRVLGIHGLNDCFEAGERVGEFVSPRLPGPVSFPDLQREFS